MGKMRFQKFIKFSRKRKMPSWVTFRKWSISKCNWMLYFNLFSVFKKMKYKGTLQSICITSGTARISGKNCNLWLVLLLLVKIYLTTDSLSSCACPILNWYLAFSFFVAIGCISRKWFHLFEAYDLVTLDCAWVAVCVLAWTRTKFVNGSVKFSLFYIVITRNSNDSKMQNKLKQKWIHSFSMGWNCFCEAFIFSNIYLYAKNSLL